MTGLAWTQYGGEILQIESTLMKGRGTLTLTGSLGDVMKESAQAAMSYVRSRGRDLHLDAEFFQKHEIHVHVPAGAIPKDGPSAGVTMTTSLYSLLSGRAVRKDVAMTGEVTLRGRVLPVGGIKEKVLAAIRTGIKVLIIPKQNERDLVEIPPHIRRKVRFVTVSHVDEVLAVALRDEVVAPLDVTLPPSVLAVEAVPSVTPVAARKAAVKAPKVTPRKGQAVRGAVAKKASPVRASKKRGSAHGNPRPRRPVAGA